MAHPLVVEAIPSLPSRARLADTGNPVGDSVVVARSGTLVVEVQYNHSSRPIDQIEDVAVTGTAAVLGKLLEAG